MKIQDLIQEVRRLAAENPDNKYLNEYGCFYDEGQCSNGSIGCLFGQALDKFGRLYGSGLRIDNLLRDMGISAENELEWCRIAQGEQDFGKEWAKCVEIADKKVIL